MKKCLLAILLLSINLCAYAQLLPKGMNYQAIARDASGKILANQTLDLRISLIGDAKGVMNTHYTEIHQVKTNEGGLFTLIVGDGSVLAGSFYQVPWSSEEIWMNIEVKSKEDINYNMIVNSKLLAVPYAFHAVTANELAAQNTYIDPYTTIMNGVPSANWSCKGNSGTKPPQEYLGTSDAKDLVMKTNNLTRLVITASGNINISNSLNVGTDVTVGQDLYVARNVYLNTGLAGSTINNGPFSVNNASPTVLTGTLRGDGDATFKQHVTLDNAAHGSTSPSTGALVVAGGAGVGENLNVGGDVNVNGKLDVDGGSTLNSTLDVDGATTLNSTLDVDGASTLNSTLDVDGVTTLNSSLDVDGASTLNSTLTVTGLSTINNSLNVNPGTGQVKITGAANGLGDLNTGAYPLYVSGAKQGILVKVDETDPSYSNNYMTFINSANAAKGCIQGQTMTELHNSFDYIFFHTFNALESALQIAMVAVDIVGVDDADAAIVEGVELVDIVAQWALEAVEIENKQGIVFESGSADYAEWLERQNPDEQMSPAEIVGVNGGKISKNTNGATQLMVVSTAPLVLGNMPKEEEKAKFEKVAFMGQVPVKVRGEVSVGDYIVASGNNDGFGYGISPAEMTAADFKNVVGVAWSSAKNAGGIGFVNTAVGINTNDMAVRLSSQQKEIETLKDQMSTVMAYLNKQGAGLNVSQPVQAQVPVQQTQKADVSTNDLYNRISGLVKQDPEMLDKIIANAKQICAKNNVEISKYPEIEKIFNRETMLQAVKDLSESKIVKTPAAKKQSIMVE